MKRLVAAVVVAVSLGSLPLSAQGFGVALAVFSTSPEIDWEFRPFRVTPTGIQYRFDVLCYHTGTRAKVSITTFVEVLDGTSLLGTRDAWVTAIIAGCGERGIVVPRAAVLVPAFQQGQ